MFNVIRIPTKFSRTLKRFSQKEKSELLDILICIGDGETITLPDNIIGDTISLIYGEWMNMESKNGKKPEKSLIQYSSDNVAPSKSEARIEYSIVEENKIKENINLSKDKEQSSELVKVDKRVLEIDLIIETIKNLNGGIVDDTVKKQRQYGKLIKDKLEKIQGFNGDYTDFITKMYNYSNEYQRQYFRSLESFYFNIAGIIAGIKTQIQIQQKEKGGVGRV